MLPTDISNLIYELKGGLEHRDKFSSVVMELHMRFLWVSSICGYQETLIPSHDFITELLITNKNNLKLNGKKSLNVRKWSVNQKN